MKGRGWEEVEVDMYCSSLDFKCFFNGFYLGVQFHINITSIHF